MKRVKITSGASGLGDTICTLGYVDEYQRKHEVELYYPVNESYRCLFDGVYTNIKFYDTDIFDETIKIDIYYDKPMMKSVADKLGLEYREIRPKINCICKDRPIKQRYVTLSMQSTHQGRYWNYRNGWDDLIRILKKKYKLSVVCIDKYESFGCDKVFNLCPKEAINRCGLSLSDVTNYIHHAEFHIGLSTGLSWLAYGLNKPVVMVCNVTKKWFEFQSDCIKIINENVCHGCLNEIDYKEIQHQLNTNWHWCAKYESDKKRIYECTKNITVEMILNQMEPLLKNYI